MSLKSPFDLRKETVIKDFYASFNDKSPKGSVDEPILSCINLLNQHSNYYTTSSCSGRVAVFCEASREKLKNGFWLFVSHNSAVADGSVTLSGLISDLEQKLMTVPDLGNRFVYFKFEPLILHVECRDEESARHLYSKVYQLGFRNSGISISLHKSSKNVENERKYVVAIRSSLKLDAPIVFVEKNDDVSKCSAIVSEEYFAILLQIANEKFILNEGKIKELERAFESLL